MTGPSVYNLRRQQPPVFSKLVLKRAPLKKQSKILPKVNPIESDDMCDPYKLPKRSKEAWDMALSLQEDCSVKENILLQNFGYVMEHEGKLHKWVQMKAACYAELSTTISYYKELARKYGGIYKELLKEREGNPLFFVDWSLMRYEKDNDEDHNLFLEWADWVANKSIWRKAFISKNPEELLAKAAIFHTVHPIRFVIGGAMMLRYIYEHPHVIKTWDVLRKHLPENVAFFIANLVFFDKNQKELSKRRLTSHSVFDNMNGYDEKLIFQSLYFRDFSHMKQYKSMEEVPWVYNKLPKIWTEPGDTVLTFPNPDAGTKGNGWNVDTRKWINIERFCREICDLNLKKEEKNA